MIVVVEWLCHLRVVLQWIWHADFMIRNHALQNDGFVQHFEIVIFIFDTMFLIWFSLLMNVDFPFLQFEFMGNKTSNPFVPFQINYKFSNAENAFQAETKKCNESYPVNIDIISIWYEHISSLHLFSSEFSTLRMCRLSVIVSGQWKYSTRW